MLERAWAQCHLGLTVAALCLSSACNGTSRKGTSAPPGVSTSQVLLAPTQPASVIPTPSTQATQPRAAEPRVVIAGPDGVFEIGRNGSVRRRLGVSKDASYPRFASNGAALLFLVNGEALHEYDFATQIERKLAGPWETVSKCGEKLGAELSPQSDDDVDVDADNRHVCIDLIDRNANMASVKLSLRIDRDTGRIEQRSVYDFDCKSKPEQESFNCKTSTPSESPAGRTFAYAWDETQHALTGPAGRTWPIGGGFHLGATSPDSRWVALRGNQEDHDYIHFNWLLVDLEQGQVFTLPDSTSAKVEPRLASVQLTELHDPSRERLGVRAGDYVGDAPLRFVGSGLLLAEYLLVDLEARSIARLSGHLAY